MSDLHAMRMRRIDESEAASRRTGVRTMYLHLSALSPTTRKSHADRHGELFTADQVRAFWADPANVEGCRCSVSPIMVGADGKPIVPGTQRIARETYQKMKARGYPWAIDT